MSWLKKVYNVKKLFFSMNDMSLRVVEGCYLDFKMTIDCLCIQAKHQKQRIWLSARLVKAS